MAERRTITVLHVSDTQFGAHHRDDAEGVMEQDKAHTSLAARLLADVDWLRRERGVSPDLVVASGDLAEWARPAEFNQFYDFLTELATGLGLSHSRVAMVPGNHDVNWKKCEAYFLNCQGDGTEPVRPYWPKWEPYAQMFTRFYDGVPEVSFACDQPWTLFEVPELKTVIAGLNSTMVESHRDEDHYGYCGEAQLRAFAERLSAFERDGWLRIGVMHHNPVIDNERDDAFLRDRASFREVLAPRLHMLLHGHTHQGRVESFGPDALPVLCSGSVGVRQNARPDDVPNQYQLVEITRTGLNVHGRRYNPDRLRWEADTAIGRDPDKSVLTIDRPLRDARATFPDPERDEPGRDDHVLSAGPPYIEFVLPRDDLLSRVRRVCELRHRDAKVEEVRNGPREGYLRVARSDGRHVSMFPVGVYAGRPGRDEAEAFLAEVDALYRAGDPYLTSFLVYDGEPVPDELRRWAELHGLQLQNLARFQGMDALRPYADRQASRLADSDVYPSELFVPQRFVVVRGGRATTLAPAEPEVDLLARLREWVADHEGRFVVVLGNFGYGKTFLLRELTRLVQEEGRPPVIPILIQLRELEKAHSLDELLAAHLTAGGEEVIDLQRLRYLIEEGRVLLLFDGFDELALRITYDQAAEHLKSLVQAARGRAKVVLTSRTQHFLSERQVETALSAQLSGVPGHRLVKLLEFDDGQILEFLTRQMEGDEDRARARLALLDDVRDLLGLSRNPRMLSFIARLDEDRLRQIRDHEGEISAARLYRELLQQWLEFEFERAQPRGAMRALSVADRWNAVRTLALRLWESGENTLGLAELGGAASALGHLADLQITPEQASHMIGSGTLLVRTEGERFTFVHRSVMEWLVADHVAKALRDGDDVGELSTRRVSDLMADFVATLAGRQRSIAWARAVLARNIFPAGIAKVNALVLLRRLDVSISDSGRAEIDLTMADLRGVDLSGADLRAAKLFAANLEGARLDGTDLSGALLHGANFTGVSGRGLRLVDATLTRANFSRARLLGADLTGATTINARWRRAALVGARLDAPEQIAQAYPDTALPGDGTPSLQQGPVLGVITSLAWGGAVGEILAAGMADGTLAVWDASTGQPIRSLPGHMGGTRAIAISEAGMHMATSGDDGCVRIWDIATGTPVRTLGDHGFTVRAVAFSPDGNRLATVRWDRNVNLWDRISGELLGSFTTPGRVHALAYSPDGASLAAVGDNAVVHVWDLATGLLVNSWEGDDFQPLYAAAYSPKGTHLAIGGSDGVIHTWDVKTGTVLWTAEGYIARVRALLYWPDGSRLISSGGGDTTIRVWDTRTGETTQVLEGHRGQVNALARNLDGTAFASGGDDGTVRVWEAATRVCSKTLDSRLPGMRAIAHSWDGAHLASVSYDGVLCLWDAATGHLSLIAPGTPGATTLAYSPDGTHIAVGGMDGITVIWDVAAGRRVQVIESETGWVSDLAYSADGLHLAAATEEMIRVWDATTGETVRTLPGGSNAWKALVYSPDGSRLAVCEGTEPICVWDTATGRLLRAFGGRADSGVTTIAYSPDGTRLATSGPNHVVEIWDVETGESLRLLRGHDRQVRAVAFSPGGDRLVSTGDDHTVRVWDTGSGDLLHTLRGHQGFVLSVSHSPDGRQVASAGSDGTIRIWDAVAGEAVATLLPLQDGWAAFSPDGLTYKYRGTPGGAFWWAVGLCTFAPGELDEFVPELRRVDEDTPLTALAKPYRKG
ncbi:pentapeptide repeat-containing protein [Microbispora amethystogenes]|uniref:pentapeptide repeat-containing protein n=1 Tax=Microbispora amethystogenes TaxID=1427754 RepID=UPI0033C9D419